MRETMQIHNDIESAALNYVDREIAKNEMTKDFYKNSSD
jgi:hypothetical protein